MPSVQQDVDQIRTATYGKDVREAIANGIEHCYYDADHSITAANDAASDALTQAGLAAEAAGDANAAALRAETAVQQIDDVVEEFEDLQNNAVQVVQQSFDDNLKAIARGNIGAASNSDLADVSEIAMDNRGYIGDLNAAVDVLKPTATSEDVGKALIAKTVTNGKVTEYEFGKVEEGLTEEAKAALLACFRHVAWADTSGQALYDALYNALMEEPPVVIKSEWIYHFNDNLLSSGSHDFGFTSITAPTYVDGKFGKAVNFSESKTGSVLRATPTAENILDLSGDFTIAAWFKTGATTIDQATSVIFRNSIRESTSASVTILPPTTWYNGYRAYTAYSTLKRNNVGVSLNTLYLNNGSVNGNSLWLVFYPADTSVEYLIHVHPDSIALTANTWHHIAMCRKDGVITYYFNGQKVCSVDFSGTLYTPNFLTVGGRQANVNDFTNMTIEHGSNVTVDELYINDEECLYTDEFTPPIEPY